LNCESLLSIPGREEPQAKLWSLSLRSRMVSAVHGRVERMRVHGSIPATSICSSSLQNVGAVRRGSTSAFSPRDFLPSSCSWLSSQPLLPHRSCKLCRLHLGPNCLLNELHSDVSVSTPASIRTFCLRNAHTAKGSASFRQGRVWRRPKRPRTGSGGRTRSQRTPSMMTLRPLARNAKRLGVRLRSLGAATKGAEWIEEFTMSLSGLTPQMNGEATERYQR